ncbi:hypothetical protein GCM10022224_053130 [Nonomuraea antimicrobica]|uniref:Uncharacterized protein n=1 Tax=Nonomuraea antimicrobica TaxID=561173 RepID=A0ABP7CBU0_9ACTN
MRRRRASCAVRAVLLVALALGIGGMHTLGHLDGRHGAAPGGAHATEVAPAAPSVVPAGLVAFVPDRTMPGFDPTDVCLAVLASLVVLLLGAGWAWAGRRSAAGVELPSSVRRVARPPPKLTSRRLAVLSMLRI